MQAGIFIESYANGWIRTSKNELELFVFCKVYMIPISAVSEHNWNNFLEWMKLNCEGLKFEVDGKI